MPLAEPVSERVLRDLRELATRTSTERGAQRVAWGPVWREARAWFAETVKRDLGLTPRIDSSGNAWVTLEGASAKSIIFGSHLDSVPSGGCGPAASSGPDSPASTTWPIATSSAR